MIGKPVLIVGAGPVGLTMASELKRFGVAVRIIDKSPQRTDKSKALIVWSRTLELLDRGGGSQPFVDAGMKVEAVNIMAGEKQIGRLALSGVRTPYPYGLMLPQSETERLLEERLSTFGVGVERCVELLSIENDAQEVRAVLRLASGEEQTVLTDWLVGCDGAHSAVRHGVGAPFTGQTMDSDWLLADVHLKGYPYPDSEASVYWHQDGVFIIFPISPGRYRLIADLPPSGADHPPTPTLEDIQKVIDRRGPSGIRAFDPIWLAGFRINGRKVSRYRWGRSFLVGDAAHVHSPAGGQGMNTGMQDAFNLAWKLAMVIQKRGFESLLDSYSSERSAIGDQVLKAADRLTEVGTTKNPVAQAVRNLVGQVLLGLGPIQSAVARTMSEVSIGYPDSPLNGSSFGHEGPQPGERIEPVSGRAPVGSGSAPRFALFARRSAATSELISHFAALLDPELRAPYREDGIWLVRPDGYVACSADDAGVIARYLEAISGSGVPEAV
ncbi:MAG: FAD-dependent monooxygenase [Burkholderiaceae bacterium]